jgi:hypothetical protein|tara:strand:+ start:4142 stop:4780 length:639 start_codon:yes stop_codon:yes gene_type:complete
LEQSVAVLGSNSKGGCAGNIFSSRTKSAFMSATEEKGEGPRGAFSQEQTCATANPANFVGGDRNGVGIEFVKALWPLSSSLHSVHMKEGTWASLANELDELWDGVEPSKFVISPLDGDYNDILIQQGFHRIGPNDSGRVHWNSLDLEALLAKSKGGFPDGWVLRFPKEHFCRAISFLAASKPLDPKVIGLRASSGQNERVLICTKGLQERIF